MKQWISILTPFFLWGLLVWLLEPPAYFVPSPWAVLQVMMANLPLLVHHVWVTFSAAIVGWVVAIVMGLSIGLLLFISSVVRFWCLPWVLLSQAIPLFAIAPLLVLWLGYGFAAKVMVTALMIFFPITLAFYEGLKTTPSDWLEMAQAMGAKPWRVVRYLRVPYALSCLLPSVKMATVWAPMGAVLGEWVGSSEGLGFLMLDANAHLDAAMLFAALFILVLLTLVFYRLVSWGLHLGNSQR